MLSDTEFRKLAELLIGPVETEGSNQPLVGALPAGLVRLLPANGSLKVMVDAAIRICVDDGYSRRPSAISVFLRNMAEHVAIPDELEQFADRLEFRPPSVDPYEDLVLRKDLPYLDRKELRRALRRNVTFEDYPILLINGPSGSGKSFTARLIDHLVKNEPNLDHCMIRAPDGAEPPTAFEIAKDMLTVLGESASVLPANTTNDKKWPQELANEVAVQLKARTEAEMRTWLTVLDVSGGKPIAEDVTAFVNKLVESLMTGVGRDRHRIILMNFPEEALPGKEADMQVVALEGLSTGELSDELNRLFTQLGRADAIQLSQGVLDGLPPLNEDLREIGRRSTAIVRKLVA